MQLVLSEDQELLAKTAADFVAERSSIARMRKLRDADDPVGFSRALWKEMAELGWVGIPFPESVGGAGLGFAELAVVLEALGRTLAPEPFLGTVLLGGQALLLGGSEEQRHAWLPGVVEGEKLLSLAFQEQHSRFELHRVATRAQRDGAGYRLSGEKEQVPDGATADAILVPARTAGDESDASGVSLFLVPAGTPGLSVERQLRVDSRPVARLRLEGVQVGPEALVGELDGGASLLERVADCARAGLAAEALGAASEAFGRTLTHLKQREQFGQPIGSFQALQHRAARLFIELELARSSVMAATRALDEESPEAPALCSLAKARGSDSFLLVANEAIQMHGGIGMTDEHDIGFYLKRARALEMTLGDAAWQRARWASLRGY